MLGIIQNIKNLIISSTVSILNCFPIKNNKIFIFSYYGSQYGCSPKYISEYLINNYSAGEFDIVWQFNDINKNLDLSSVRQVKTMSLKALYELCTAKVIITNYRTTDVFKKRKSQYYIQTWHSSLRLKQIEKDAEETLPHSYIEMAKKDSKKCDLLLSGCQFSSDIFKRAFWYDGEIFEHGTPRSDMFFTNNYALNKKVKRELDIEENKNIVLYAPTFRKNNDLKVYNVNYEKVLNALNDKFGGEWVFLVRLHPHLVNISKELVYGENVIDVTKYGDIQELLSVSDVLISDYSSLMFDFALTERPCFLYVPDLEEYVNNDRNLYFNIKELPFVNVANNDELIKKIKRYDSDKYKLDLKSFNDKIGSFENGHACEKLSRRIKEVCLS